MEKKLGSVRAGSTSLQSPSGVKTPSDSGQTPDRSKSGEVYVNEHGEVCYGNGCFTLRVDKERGDIIVNVKQDSTCNAEPLIEAMREVLGKKSRTVYEIENPS